RRNCCRCFSSSSLHSLHALQGEIDLLLRCLLRLFDEAMQQHHAAAAHAEDDSRDSALHERTSHLPKSTARRTDKGQTQRPGELDILDVFADEPPVFRRQLFQPFTDRLAPTGIAIEPCRKSLQLQLTIVSNMVHRG